MADSYRTLVQISVAPGDRTSSVAGLEVGHFLQGAHDGMTRLELAFHDGEPAAIVLALGPVAATKLGPALLAASFDHRAALERWDSDT